MLDRAKIIESLDKDTKLRIKKGIERLAATPPEGDIKRVQGFDRSATISLTDRWVSCVIWIYYDRR